MGGRLYGQRKGEGPYTKGQSIKIISHKEKKKLIGMLIDERELERDEGDRRSSPETSSSLEANRPWKGLAIFDKDRYHRREVGELLQ